MHMADALISATVGGTMLVASGGTLGNSIKKIQEELDDKKIPLMGVVGAFVFAGQMINFTIPGTGSSGHIGGGILLAALLGPYAGFIAMASILLIQALFFGDGGLLAYGCNVFNMGFFTCFIAYPYVYKKIIQKGITPKRIFFGALIAVIVGLQLGAFGVVVETLLSGITELPFKTFVVLMQPIHLAIGIVEGLITAAVITFVWKMRPEILDKVIENKKMGKIDVKKVIATLAICTLIVGGGVSWFASGNPDGLEWSMEKVAGTTELEAEGKVHSILSSIQEKTAFLPDYNFKVGEGESEEGVWPAINVGTTVSGIVGGVLTLGLIAGVSVVIYTFKKKKRIKNEAL